MNKLNLISYFGGKYPHLKWLTDQFPKGDFHFVDIMCGSANVALNVNYPLITINDLNEDVINLFEVLRTREEELTRAIYFTPFSRQELYRIIDNYYSTADAVERARRFFVRSQLGYGANGSQNNHKGAGFEWGIQKSQFYRVDNWNAKLRRFAEIAHRLRGMQIEHRSALDLFAKVDRKDCIVYFDPPYELSTRKSKKRYTHEVENDFHEALAVLAPKAKCYLAISGYESPMYNKLFKAMHKIKGPPTKSTVSKSARQECLWTNYIPEEVNFRVMGQMSLLDQIEINA